MSSKRTEVVPASQEVSTTISFTGIVVTYNEDARLRECLESLSFCNQVIVCDLGSEDRSTEIALDCGAEVIYHKRLQIYEKVQKRIVHLARHDWIIFLDPDEVFDDSLVEEVHKIIRDNSNIARVRLPWKFYYKSEPLNGTHWGGQKHKASVVHRKRCVFTGEVHRGVKVRDGFKTETISWTHPSKHIKHYWMDSHWQLFEKHWRYIKQEGKVKYKNGERFNWGEWLRSSVGSFKNCLIGHGGWREGLRGLFLSVFWAWYVSASLLSLYCYERKISN